MDIGRRRNIVVYSFCIGLIAFLLVLLVNKIGGFVQWFGDALIYLLFLVL